MLGKETPEKLDDAIAALLKGKIVFVVGTVTRGVRPALIDAEATVAVSEKITAPGWTGRASDPGAAGGSGRLTVRREALSNAIGKAIYQPKTIPAMVTELGESHPKGKHPDRKDQGDERCR